MRGRKDQESRRHRGAPSKLPGVSRSLPGLRFLILLSGRRTLVEGPAGIQRARNARPLPRGLPLASGLLIFAVPDLLIYFLLFPVVLVVFCGCGSGSAVSGAMIRKYTTPASRAPTMG